MTDHDLPHDPIDPIDQQASDALDAGAGRVDDRAAASAADPRVLARAEQMATARAALRVGSPDDQAKDNELESMLGSALAAFDAAGEPATTSPPSTSPIQRPDTGSPQRSRPHPAVWVAVAAVLLLVVGLAGLFTVRGGEQLASDESSSQAAESLADAPPSTVATTDAVTTTSFPDPGLPNSGEADGSADAGNDASDSRGALLRLALAPFGPPGGP